MDLPTTEPKSELQLLQENYIRLSKENDDLNKSKNGHLKMIADLEETLDEQRKSYQQLLKVMVETTEENAEFSVQLEKLKEVKTALEKELDDVRGKMSRVGDDFEKLQEMFNQQEATNQQIKSGYAKYKSGFYKLKAKMNNLCQKGPSQRKLNNISLFEGKTRMELSNCVNEIVENETDICLRNISRIVSNVNSGKLKRLRGDCEILCEKCFSREKQFTRILNEARARVLSLQESARTYQTEINRYKERITFLERENKEMILKKENEIEDSASKKLSCLEEDKIRLQGELVKTHHRVKILTQKVDTLQQLSRFDLETVGGNMNADYPNCFSTQKKEMTSVTNEFQSVTETIVERNSINHSVLRTISLTSDPSFTDNSFGGSLTENLKWFDEDDEKQEEDIRKKFNGVTFNRNRSVGNSNVSLDSSASKRTFTRKMMYTNKTTPQNRIYQCNLCTARCATLKNLGQHKKKVHPRTKDGVVAKVANSHCTIKNYNR